jgi:L-threonylcarbamoyladenylate synthase
VIDDVVAAVAAGQPVVVPTDTVYGLAADARNEEAVRRLYRLKGRGAEQPTALVAADVDGLVEVLPELRGPAEAVARSLLPGPYTLIVSNPARRLSWLTGKRPTTIGIRVPAVSGDAAVLLRQVGTIAATSANRPGEADPRSVDEIPDELLQGCGAVLDVGRLPGTPSTVVDLTGPDPVVLREGAVPAEEALARVKAPTRRRRPRP